MKYIYWLLLLISLTLLLYVVLLPKRSFSTTSASTNIDLEPVKPLPYDTDRFLTLINEARVGSNLKPLLLSERLCPYADKRLIEIQTDWSHNGFKKTSQKEISELNLKRLGENLSEYDRSTQPVTEKDVVYNWMLSKTHRDNILYSPYTSTCIRCDTIYCVQIFAR